MRLKCLCNDRKHTKRRYINSYHILRKVRIKCTGNDTRPQKHHQSGQKVQRKTPPSGKHVRVMYYPRKPNFHIKKLGFEVEGFTYLSCFCSKTSIADIRWNRLSEAVLTFTHKQCCVQNYLNYYFFPMNYSIFAFTKNFYILHGQVFVITKLLRH